MLLKKSLVSEMREHQNGLISVPIPGKYPHFQARIMVQKNGLENGDVHRQSPDLYLQGKIALRVRSYPSLILTSLSSAFPFSKAQAGSLPSFHTLLFPRT